MSTPEQSRFEQDIDPRNTQILQYLEASHVAYELSVGQFLNGNPDEAADLQEQGEAFADAAANLINSNVLDTK
jgi:hypothetical protein